MFSILFKQTFCHRLQGSIVSLLFQKEGNLYLSIIFFYFVEKTSLSRCSYRFVYNFFFVLGGGKNIVASDTQVSKHIRVNFVS